MPKALNIAITGDASKFVHAADQTSAKLAKLEGDAAKHTGGIKGHFSSLSGVGSSVVKAGTDMSGAVGGLTSSLSTSASAFGPWGMAAGAGIAAIGSGVGTLVSFANKAEDLGLTVGKLQRLTGGSAEEMSTFAFAAQQTGVDTDGLGRGIIKLSKNMEDNKAVFTQLGVATRDSSGNLRDTFDVMADLGDVFAGMEDGPEKTALAMELFGKTGNDLMPMLKEGREGLAAYKREAQEYGLVLGQDNVNDAKKAKAAQRDLSAAWTGLQVELGQSVLPTVTEFIRDFANGMKALGPVIDNFKAGWHVLQDAFNQGGIGGAMSKIWETISPHLQSFLQAFGNWVTTTALPWLGAKAQEMAAAFGSWIWQQIQETPGRLAQLVGLIGNWVTGTALPWLAGKAGELAGMLGSFILQAAKDAPGNLAHLAGAVLGWIARQALELPGHLLELGKTLLGWIVTAVTEAPGKLLEFAGKVQEFLAGLPSKILEWVGDAASWLLDVGRNVLEGLWNGVSNAVPWLIDQLKGLPGKFLEGFKSAFQISSPSKVMMPMGEALAQGVGVGFQQAWQSDVLAPMSALANTVSWTDGIPIGYSYDDLVWDGQNWHDNTSIGSPIYQPTAQDRAGIMADIGSSYSANATRLYEGRQPIIVPVHIDGYEVTRVVVNRDMAESSSAGWSP